MTTPVPELETRALSLPQQAKELRITDQSTYDRAAELVKVAVALRKEIEAHHAPLKQKARASWQAIVDAEKALLDSPAEAERILKAARLGYERECERKRLEEEARMREEQRKRDEEMQLAEAVEAEQMGVSDKDVDAILNEPPIATPVVAPPLLKKSKGFSTRETWSAFVEYFSELVKAVAAGRVPIQALSPNMTFLNGQARMMRLALNYPGVRVVRREGEAVRTK